MLGMFATMFPYSWDETNITGEIKKKFTGSCFSDIQSFLWSSGVSPRH